MYTTLITKIGTTLDSVSLVKDYFYTPKKNLTKFPCVFFKPDGFSNEFETNEENMKVYSFMMIVMVGVQQITAEQAFITLANVVDAIVDQFDEDWDMGTVDGHRVRVKIDSLEAWQMSEEQEGLMAYAPLNLEIKLLTSN